MRIEYDKPLIRVIRLEGCQSIMGVSGGSFSEESDDIFKVGGVFGLDMDPQSILDL